MLENGFLQYGLCGIMYNYIRIDNFLIKIRVDKRGAVWYYGLVVEVGASYQNQCIAKARLGNRVAICRLLLPVMR